MRSPQKTRRSKAPFFLALFCLLLLSLGGYFGANHHIIEKALRKNKKNFNENQYLQTLMAARGITSVLENTTQRMSVLAHSALADFLEGKRSPASISSLFQIELAEGEEYLLSLALFLEPGPPLLHSTGGSPRRDHALELAKQWNTVFWEQKSALPEGTFFFPPPYLRENEQYLGILTPLYSGRVCRGVLFGTLDLTALSRHFVSPLRSGNYGAGYLLSGSGDVLFDHETQIIGRNVFDGLHENYPDLLRLDEQLVTEPSGKGEYTFLLERGQKASRKLVAWHSLETANLRLVIALSAPEREIEDAMKETKLFQLFSTVLLFLLVISIMFVLFRWQENLRVSKSEERMKLALKGNQDGLWDHNPLTGKTFYSKRWKEMLGYGEGEIGDSHEEWTQRIHPEDREKTLRAFAEHLSGKTASYENEHRLFCKNGAYKWIHSRGMALERTDKGKAKRVLGTHTDIDVRKENEMELRKFSLAVEQSSSAILITDTEGTIRYINASFEKINGFSREEALGKNPRILKSGRQNPWIYRDLWQTISSGSKWRGEMINRRKDGAEIWVRVSIAPVLDEKGRVTGYVGMQEDITEIKEAEFKLQILATTDELTGLWNRRKFMERATEEQKRALRYGFSLGLIMFDVDRFKQVNDTHGHDVGDSVLRHMAEIVQSTLRETDVVARLGGEEFAILLLETTRGETLEIIERVRLTLEETPFITSNQEPVAATASFGIAMYHAKDEGKTMDTLLKQADQAMYHAKTEGRNRIAFFDEEHGKSTVVSPPGATEI